MEENARLNALKAAKAADFDDPVMCAMHGQAYLAETSLAPSAGEYLRIVCIRAINPTTAHG